MRVLHANDQLTSTGRPGLLAYLKPAILGELLLRLWQANRERRSLADLDPRLLRDMGIDPMAAHYEAERPFWQLPEHHEAQLRRRLVQ